MKTLRNLAVAALLTFAAVVIHQQSAYAYDPTDACQGPSPYQQCAIVPGGYPHFVESECQYNNYEELWQVRTTYVCRRDDPPPPAQWGNGSCWEYFPNGSPVTCG